MAADALEQLDSPIESLDNERRIAEYHAYAGISAAGKAINATASRLLLGQIPRGTLTFQNIGRGLRCNTSSKPVRLDKPLRHITGRI